MLSKLMQLFDAPNAAQDETSDGRVALSALLVRIARADGHFDEDERRQIAAVLATRYNLTAEQAEVLVAEGAAFEADTGDTVALTRALKQAFDVDQRHALLEDLWSVVLADGERETHEDQLMRLVAHLLGITDRDSAMARQRAASR